MKYWEIYMRGLRICVVGATTKADSTIEAIRLKFIDKWSLSDIDIISETTEDEYKKANGISD